MLSKYFAVVITVLSIACVATVQAAEEYGTAVGEFNGVVAYSNGSCDNATWEYNTDAGTNTGMKWQCVEYVNRYYWSVYGVDLRHSPIYGNANTYYSNARLVDFLNRFPNNGTERPQPGDIICSASGNYGHVAIVREVLITRLTIIQQNFYNDKRDNESSINYFSNDDGTYTLSYMGHSMKVQGWVRLKENPTGVDELPAALTVSEPYPNPFNPTTTIDITVPHDMPVTATVYNVAGQRVAELHNGMMTAGSHSVTWRADGFPSGLYLCRIDTGSAVTVRKLMLAK